MLFGEVEDLNLRRASRKVLVGGQSGKAQTFPCSEWWDGELHSSLPIPEITGHCWHWLWWERSRNTKMKYPLWKEGTVFSLLCRFWAVQCIRKQSWHWQPMTGTHWASQCWTRELQPPERHRSICWAQGTAGAGLHGLTRGEPLRLTALCLSERQQLLVPGGFLLACYTSNLSRKNP